MFAIAIEKDKAMGKDEVKEITNILNNNGAVEVMEKTL